MDSIQGFVHIFRFLLFFYTSITVAAATENPLEATTAVAIFTKCINYAN